MNTHKRSIAPLLLAIVLLALPLATLALQTPGGGGSFGALQENLQGAGEAAFGTGATERTLPEIIGRVIQVFLTIVGVIFMVLMVYAGYLWMTAQGEEAKVDKAKDTIKAAVIGLTVVVAAYAITNFVVSGLISAASG